MMKTSLFFISLALSASLLAQDPPTVPTIIYVSEGDSADFRTTSSIPINWFEPSVILDWPSAPTGFGARDRFSEVSTVLNFSSIQLRQHFISSGTPETLTLSVKHDALPLDAYINGQAVLSLGETELPDPDADGFRHYDLTPHIALLATENLLAMRIQGSIAVPILHGTTSDLNLSKLAIDPTKTRLIEGGQARQFRIFKNPLSSHSARILLQQPDGSDIVTSDYEIRKDGVPVPIQDPTSSPYFLPSFNAATTSSVYEIIARDDRHAEALETLVIKPLVGPDSISMVIPRNDVGVTRTQESGEGSLRQAIENAEFMTGLETIRFLDDEGILFSQAPVTITIGEGSSAISSLREGFTIEGPPSPGRVTIQMSGARFLSITGGAPTPAEQDITLRRLIIRGSSLGVSSSRYGGSILIEDCEFIDNDRALDFYNLQSAPVVRRCLFLGNRQECIDASASPTPVIQNCTFADNHGTAIDLGRRSAPLIESCTFMGENRFVSGRAQFKNCLLAGTGDVNLSNTDFDQGGNLFAGVFRGELPVTPSHPDSLTTTFEDAALGALDFHGGFTRSIPILADSPALDLGLPPDSASPDSASPEFDQRGDPFLRRVGPTPDAGAYELQFDSGDLVIALETEVIFDDLAGLYFQFAIVHNTSPWTIPGFRLHVTGLPDDAILYNASGEGFIDVAGPVSPTGYRVVILQYLASRPDLNLSPQLQIDPLPNWDSMESISPHSPEVAVFFESDGKPCLEFRTIPNTDYRIEITEDLKNWRPVGPVLSAESQSMIWKSPEPDIHTQQYYRVVAIE